jgi:single-stranded DNA-binding protein
MSGIEAAFFGSLARDAEAKTSKAGKVYVRFTCRVGDGDGAQWVNVTAFDEKAVEQADKFIKGARCYVEGSIKLDEWTGQDGAKRHGLSCMSWHSRLAAIGRNKPPSKRSAKPKGQAAAPAPTGAASPVTQFPSRRSGDDDHAKFRSRPTLGSGWHRPFR